MRRLLGILGLLAASAACATGAASAAPRTAGWSGQGLVAPAPNYVMPLFGWRPTLHQTDQAATAPRAEVRRESGWQRLGFDVGERTSGVYLQVKGRAQFDRAEVVFADGALESYDLKQTERGKGVYELATFDSERDVMCVRLFARASSSRAQVSVRLER